MKKILVSILSVLMVLALAAPVSAEDPTTKDVTTIVELESAINDENVTVINIKNQLVFNDAATLDFAGKKVNVEIGSVGDKERTALYFYEDATVSNLDLTSTNTNMKYGISGNKIITLRNVSINGYIFAAVRVNGGRLKVDGLNASTNNGGYAAVELAMGGGITDIPRIESASNVTGGAIYADLNDVKTQITDLVQQKEAMDSIIVNIKNVAKDNNLPFGYYDGTNLVSSVAKVSNVEELSNALKDENVTSIIFTDKIKITAADNLTELDFKNKTVTLESGDKALEFSNVGAKVTVSNVTINQSGTSMNYGIHAYLTDIVLNNVEVSEPNWAGVLVNGSKLTADGYTYVPSDSSYAAVELAMGSNVKDKPSIDETSTISGGPVYADVDQINKNSNLTNEQKADIISDIEQNLINVAKKNGITAFTNENGELTQLPIPQDPTSEKPSRPTYRPSSPSKDLPSNTKECQKEFGDEYIWSDEYDACVIKFMIVDTSTK